MAFSRELDLVAACCRWPPSPARDEAVVRAAPDVDWPLLVQVVARHRVEGLVHDALRRAQIALPAAPSAALAQAATGIAHRNLAFAAAALRLHAELGEASVAHLFVKGVTLDMLAYGSLGLKRAADIDLVVDEQAYAAACDIMIAQGYACISPGPARTQAELHAWTLRYKHTIWDKAGVAVELHASLLDNPLLLPSLSVHSTPQHVAVAPGRTLPTLEPDALYAYLSVHGAAHAWSRLKWLADVNALLHRCDADELARLHDAALTLGAGRCSAQALLLCEALFGLPLGRSFAADLRRDPITRLLVRAAEKSMVRGGVAVELDSLMLGTVPIHLSHFFMARGWRYKAAEARRKLFVTGDPAMPSQPLRQVARWLARRRTT